MFKLVALIIFGSTFVSAQESPCGLLPTINCYDNDGNESCDFNQINASGEDCMKNVTIVAKVCNGSTDGETVTIVLPEEAVELSGNAISIEDRGKHSLNGDSATLTQGQCMERSFTNLKINTCKKKYNVKINADAETSDNDNCRAFLFKGYRNKRLCRVSVKNDCTVVEDGEVDKKCSETFYSSSTCGVKKLKFDLSYCNNNNWPLVSIRPIDASTTMAIGGQAIDTPNPDLPAGECKTVTEYRDVDTCTTYAPSANTLLNARILDSNGSPDPINNQHCYSNSFLARHGWGMPYSIESSSKPSAKPSTKPSAEPSAEPSLDRTDTDPFPETSSKPSTKPSMEPSSKPTMKPSNDGPTKTPSNAPTATPSITDDCNTPTLERKGGDNSKGSSCSKGSKGSKGSESNSQDITRERRQRRRNVRNRRNL